MAALNIKETESLNEAASVIQNAGRLLAHLEPFFSGDSVEPDLEDVKRMVKRLKQAETDVKTVVAMKGHYFN